MLSTEKIIDVRSFLLVFSVEQLNVEHNYIYIISPEFGHIDINVNVKERKEEKDEDDKRMLVWHHLPPPQ